MVANFSMCVGLIHGAWVIGLLLLPFTVLFVFLGWRLIVRSVVYLVSLAICFVILIIISLCANAKIGQPGGGPNPHALAPPVPPQPVIPVAPRGQAPKSPPPPPPDGNDNGRPQRGVLTITGTWKGQLSQQGTNFQANLTMTLEQDGKTITGTARIEAPRIKGAYAVMEVQGSFDGTVFTFKETRFTENRSTPAVQWVLMQGSLRFDRQ